MGRFILSIPETEDSSFSFMCPNCEQKYCVDHDRESGNCQYECEECGEYFEVIWETKIIYYTETRNKPSKTNESD